MNECVFMTLDYVQGDGMLATLIPCAIGGFVHGNILVFSQLYLPGAVLGARTSCPLLTACQKGLFNALSMRIELLRNKMQARGIPVVFRAFGVFRELSNIIYLNEQR